MPECDVSSKHWLLALKTAMNYDHEDLTKVLFANQEALMKLDQGAVQTVADFLEKVQFWLLSELIAIKAMWCLPFPSVVGSHTSAPPRFAKTR